MPYSNEQMKKAEDLYVNLLCQSRRERFVVAREKLSERQARHEPIGSALARKKRYEKELERAEEDARAIFRDEIGRPDIPAPPGE